MDTDNANNNEKKYNLWGRALYMLVFAIIYGICETILYLLAIVSMIYRVVYKKNNPSLMNFGHSLAQYVRQIADYLSFNTEQAPFPFDTWPGSHHSTQNSGEPNITDSDSVKTPEKPQSIDEPSTDA